MPGSGLVVVALWMGVLGYGVLYAGVQKLAGDQNCGLAEAFKGQCGGTSSGSSGGGVGGPRPRTLQQVRMEVRQQQMTHMAAQPLIHAGYRG